MAAGHGHNDVDMSNCLAYNFTGVTAGTVNTITFEANAGCSRFLVTAIGNAADTVGIQLNVNTGEYFEIPTGRTVEFPVTVRNFIYLKNTGSNNMDISVMIIRGR